MVQNAVKGNFFFFLNPRNDNEERQQGANEAGFVPHDTFLKCLLLTSKPHSM